MITAYWRRGGLATQLEERIGSASEVWVETGNKTGGYQVVTPSADPLSGIRYEFFTAISQTHIYQANFVGRYPSIISRL